MKCLYSLLFRSMTDSPKTARMTINFVWNDSAFNSRMSFWLIHSIFFSYFPILFFFLFVVVVVFHCLLLSFTFNLNGKFTNCEHDKNSSQRLFLFLLLFVYFTEIMKCVAAANVFTIQVRRGEYPNAPTPFYFLLLTTERKVRFFPFFSSHQRKSHRNMKWWSGGENAYRFS